MDHTRPNLTAPDGTRLRIKIYSDDPGADEARHLVVDTLLEAGFVDTDSEPEEMLDLRLDAAVERARTMLEKAETAKREAKK